MTQRKETGGRPPKPPTLRVIGGRYRHRRLTTLEGNQTRPMLDRMRQTLFDVLRNQIVGALFVDLYAGTGAVGIEALSRGARQVIFVESDPRAATVIEENLASLGARGDGLIRCSKVSEVLGGIGGDIVFLGPPYALTREYETTLTTLGQSPPGLVIAQHPSSLTLGEQYGGLTRSRTITQGKNCLSFFSEHAQEEESPG